MSGVAPALNGPPVPTSAAPPLQTVTDASNTPAIPFAYSTPYNVQTGLMRAIYTAIDSGTVGIVESPTGTGKSLSILCAALHWIFHRFPAYAYGNAIDPVLQ